MFEGFTDPVENWSKLPHSLIAALPLIQTVAELKVILYVLRHTWGYHETERRISLDEFEHGRHRRDGTRLDPGTGLSHQAVIDGLRAAIAHGFIVCITDATDAARVKKYYSLARADDDDALTQGSKDQTPEVYSLDPGGLNIRPRSKKETIETNIREKPDHAAEAAAPAPPAQSLTFDLENEVEAYMVDRLRANAAATGRRGPTRFPTIECRDKFRAAIGRLNGSGKAAIDAALNAGILSLPRLTAYIAKCTGAKKGGNNADHDRRSRSGGTPEDRYGRTADEIAAADAEARVYLASVGLSDT